MFKHTVVSFFEFLFCIVIAFIVFPNNCQSATAFNATVVKVISCNTFIVNKAGINQTIKLSGLEPSDADDDCSLESQAILENYILKKTVTLIPLSTIRKNGVDIIVANVEALIEMRMRPINNKMIQADTKCRNLKKAKAEALANAEIEAKKKDDAKKNAGILTGEDARFANAYFAKQDAKSRALKEQEAQEDKRRLSAKAEFDQRNSQPFIPERCSEKDVKARSEQALRNAAMSSAWSDSFERNSTFKSNYRESSAKEECTRLVKLCLGSIDYCCIAYQCVNENSHYQFSKDEIDELNYMMLNRNKN